jgi:Tetratricopeptide repeat
MGQSMSTVNSEWVKNHQPSGSVEDKNNNSKFEVSAAQAKLVQSQYERGAGGEQILRDSREISWIIGAGENGFAGILRKGDYLFQAPLSYYSKAQKWELSPGYEILNVGFNRPILPGCISCHSGRPNPLPEGNGHFASQPFSELAIGCENCHGPGLAHVTAARMGQGEYVGDDGLIVNPAKLTPALSNDICMSCHQIGDVRVLKPGKDYQSFRPGSVLDDTMSILLVPPNGESPPQQDLLEHYYSMTLSKCYRDSGQRLTCISCHDPHVEPSKLEASAYFRKRCLICHTEKSCTVPLHAREQQQPADDCAGCHMKKRTVREISHSSITNHRILARPDEPFPDIAFQQTTSVLPDLIHLNAPHATKGTTLPALTLLQAYGELVEKHPEYLARYLAVLQELEHTDENNPLVQAALGNRELHASHYSESLAHLQRAINGGVAKTILYTDLAEALLKLDRTDEAIATLRKATELDPFNSALRKQLIVQLIRIKDYASARKQMEDYVERFPADLFMREMEHRAKAIEETK